MPAFVQQVAARGDSVTSFPITFGSAVTAGSKVFLLVDIFQRAGGDPTSVSGLGATWTKIYTSATGGGNVVELWQGVGTTSGTTVTVTTTGLATWATLNMAEFTGVNYIGAVSSATVSSSTSATSPTQTLTASGDTALAFFEWGGWTKTYTVASDSPGAWTSMTLQTNDNSDEATVGAYRVATGASESASRQITLSAASSGLALSLALQAAAPPSAARRRPQRVVRQAVARAAVI